MGVSETLKQSFISGIFLALPVLITLFILRTVSGWAFKVVNPIVKGTNLVKYTGNIEIVAQILALIVTVVFLTFVGYVSNYKLSRQIRATAAKMMKEIPLFGSVYTTIRQISSAFQEGGDRFKKTVLVKFPQENLYSIGLITSEAPKSIEEAVADGDDMKSVFVPMSPNPTMGRLIMVKPENFYEIDMGVQRAMKLLLTSGIAYKEDEMPEEIQDAAKLDYGT